MTGWRHPRFAELDALIAAEPDRRGPRRGPRDSGCLEAAQAAMRARMEEAARRRELVKAGCPRSFFGRMSKPRSGPKPLTPEQQGYRDGLQDLHYLPQLNFRRSEDWLAWYHGWQAGQATLAERRRRATENAALGRRAP